MIAAQVIEFDQVTKRFGSIVANNAVTCRIEAGQIHGFLGENGAGKSTLMKMLSGYNQPDGGRILRDGQPMILRSPSDARRQGIGMVYQHFTLVEAMSVLDNVLLGDPRVPLFINRSSIKAQVEATAQRLGFTFELTDPVWRLGVSERQKLEIFKLLWRDAKILILDEPCSQLDPYESEEVLSCLGRLAKGGRTILLVSHKIGEMLRFASRISILRRGRCIETLESGAATFDQLARLMVGKLERSTSSPPPTRIQGAAILGLKDVSVVTGTNRGNLRIPELEIREGEVLGSAGAAGSGRNVLATLLAGQMAPTAGRLEIEGKAASWSELRKFPHKCRHIPADSLNHGTSRTLPLLDNLFLGDTAGSRFLRGPFLRRGAMRQEGLRRLREFQVSPADLNLPCLALSGGNLQRLVLARETSSKAKVLVAVNPTAGLDIAAARKVNQEFRAYVARRQAVVLISHDLQGLLDLCDRIAVFCDGELIGVETTSETNADRLGLLMGGVDSEIAGLLLAPGTTADGERRDKTKNALLQLLGSSHSWQRRLAAEIGLKSFSAEDCPYLEQRLDVEPSSDIRAWLAIGLACLSSSHLGRLRQHFLRSPASFIAVQRALLNPTKSGGLAAALEHRLREPAASWEKELARLTLAHFTDRDDLLDADWPSRSQPTSGGYSHG